MMLRVNYDNYFTRHGFVDTETGNKLWEFDVITPSWKITPWEPFDEYVNPFDNQRWFSHS